MAADTASGELVWEPLRCGRVLSLLHKPDLTLGLTCMDEPKHACKHFPVSNLGSRDELARSNARTGRLSCWMLILATFPGTSFGAINRSSMTIAPGGQKNDVVLCAKDQRCCRGLFFVASVAAG